jgi:hypothetical protein
MSGPERGLPWPACLAGANVMAEQVGESIKESVVAQRAAGAGVEAELFYHLGGSLMVQEGLVAVASWGWASFPGVTAGGGMAAWEEGAGSRGKDGGPGGSALTQPSADLSPSERSCRKFVRVTALFGENWCVAPHFDFGAGTDVLEKRVAGVGFQPCESHFSPLETRFYPLESPPS